MEEAEATNRLVGEDVLRRRADETAIAALHGDGLLSSAACEAALAWVRPPLAWRLWVGRSLLFLGAALVLSGIVFFFAYNWAKMSAFLKLGLIEAGVLACVAGAWRARLDRAGGKVLLLGAGLLVGVLLAVYGQAYQTGADAWELFAGWAVLIAGWVAISRFGAFWLMWIVIVNLGLTLYWDQVALPNEVATWASVNILLALVNALALAGRELGASRGVDWLAPRWSRWVLAAAVLALLTSPTCILIVAKDYRDAASVVAAGMWVGALAGCYGFFRFRARDLFSLALGALSFCVVVLTLLGKVMFEASHEAPMFLAFGLVVVGVFSAVALWLRRTAAAMAGESHE